MSARISTATYSSQQPAIVFATGQEAHIPFVYGTTTREFGSNQSPDQLRIAITFAAGAMAPKAIEAYGLANGGKGTTDPKYGTAADQWSADMIFRCPSVTQAAWHVAAHNATWQYEFNHAIPGQEAQGAVHSADLPYVFGFFPKTGNIAGNFTDVDKKLADLIETYWTNFAKTGNPNSTGTSQLAAARRYRYIHPVSAGRHSRDRECPPRRSMRHLPAVADGQIPSVILTFFI